MKREYFNSSGRSLSYSYGTTRSFLEAIACNPRWIASTGV